jgi:hypothetical protein
LLHKNDPDNGTASAGLVSNLTTCKVDGPTDCAAHSSSSCRLIIFKKKKRMGKKNDEFVKA